VSDNIKKISIKIQGMSCSSCVNTIEKKLNSLDGIINVTVNIATEKGQVEYNSDKINEEGILKGVESAGYTATINNDDKYEKVTLNVEGMTCTTCASKVEKTLNKLVGVVSANVNFAVEKVTIEYDSKQVRVIDMQNKVQALGYELKLVDELEDEVDEDEIKIKKSPIRY